MKILNASYHEQIFPTTWRKADVSPLPKKKPVDTLEKDLRPISLTLCISKVAEEFIVEGYVKPAILNVIIHSQYGAIPNSSTTMALISMLHHWCVNTDGNGTTIRKISIDYRKAFDFIDHGILVIKVGNLNIPRSIVNWIIDFLSHRAPSQIGKRLLFRVGSSYIWSTARYQIRTMVIYFNDPRPRYQLSIHMEICGRYYSIRNTRKRQRRYSSEYSRSCYAVARHLGMQMQIFLW